MILAAPLLLVFGGTLAYVKLTEHAPIVAVPDVVDHDVFAAIGTLKDAGFEVEATAADSPRPGGTILAQRPTNGHELEQGSTVTITVARTRATVPDVTTMNIDDAKVTLAKRGLLNVAITPDYRDDVDPGTVMSTTPAAYLKATKRDAIEVVVATDPHVKMPDGSGPRPGGGDDRAPEPRTRGCGEERDEPERACRPGAEVERRRRPPGWCAVTRSR